MPELPEVETIRRELALKITGQRILQCIPQRKDIIGYPGRQRFIENVLNEKIIRITRRAKYLILVLTHKKQLIFHLRLSGSIYTRPLSAHRERFTRISFTLDDYLLFFNEPRALGRVYVLQKNEKPDILKGLFTLGYEPISHEFDYSYFRNSIKDRKAPIKSLLLDQRICAGVGNIYSDEALFHAHIRPKRRAFRITRTETSQLLTALKKVLNKAVKYAGTSVGDYTRTDGQDGNFQKFLYVYGREFEPCRICGEKVKVTKIGNRSTRYCPKCQV